MSGALPGTLYAFVPVSALSLLMLWQLNESLLALLALVLAFAWTIDLMDLFGIRFNLANIWSLPMILGVSADFGLNVTRAVPTAVRCSPAARCWAWCSTGSPRLWASAVCSSRRIPD